MGGVVAAEGTEAGGGGRRTYLQDGRAETWGSLAVAVEVEGVLGRGGVEDVDTVHTSS